MAAHQTPCRALQPLVADLGAEGKEAKSLQMGFTNLCASHLTPKSVRYLQKSQSLLLNCAPFAFLFILTGTDSASLLQSVLYEHAAQNRKTPRKRKIHLGVLGL